ncbi:MAG: DUF4468 domain-containing protein [Bacteroidetes bacterium]|nr:DUF4468 domain-containing protein [Bacteroidota bacterium]
MKNLCLAALLLIPAALFAQKDTIGLHVPMNNGSVVYEKVFNAPGKTQMQLFNSAQEWFIGRYQTDRVIEMIDTANMRIIGKGKETVNFTGPLNASIPFDDRMSIQVDCKNGKYRCRMYSIALTIQNPAEKDKTAVGPEDMVNVLTGKGSKGGFNKAQARRMLEALNAAVDTAMASLDKTMNDSF